MLPYGLSYGTSHGPRRVKPSWPAFKKGSGNDNAKNRTGNVISRPGRLKKAGELQTALLTIKVKESNNLS